MPDYSDFNKKLSDIEFIRQKQIEGNLIKLVSTEFSGNADQISYVPASGKTFYFLKAKLYPVNDTTAPQLTSGAGLSRRADVEITNDGTVIDVLTWDYQSYMVSTDDSAPTFGVGQFDSNVFDSLIGNASKAFKLTSTNTSGTYRVTLLGWIENT